MKETSTLAEFCETIEECGPKSFFGLKRTEILV